MDGRGILSVGKGIRSVDQFLGDTESDGNLVREDLVTTTYLTRRLRRTTDTNAPGLYRKLLVSVLRDRGFFRNLHKLHVGNR